MSCRILLPARLIALLLTLNCTLNSVVFARAPARLPALSFFLLQSDEITVKGEVKNTDNEGLPGVSIFVKDNPQIGTVTDVKGEYSIRVKSNAILVFTYIGYEREEFPVNAKSFVNITLTQDIQALQEVVVVAYGEQKKESVVGAVSTVKVSEIKTAAPRSLNNVLAGKVAGIIAVQRSGEPGYDDAQFWIRGISTFGSGSNPLIIVDGVERPLNNIEPEEIETFSVLKDAAATAVYGIRGANGVVLVTTRRGAKVAPRISFKMESGIVGPTRMPDLVDGATYLELYNEAQLASNPDYQTPYTPDIIEKYRSGEDPYLYPSVDWIDVMMKKVSTNQRANLNITGGGDVAKYFVSATYYDEDGIWKGGNVNDYNTNVNLRRYNFRSNTDINLSKDTELSLGIGGILITSNYPGRGANSLWALGIMRNSPVSHAPTYPDSDPKNQKGFVYAGVNGIENGYQMLTGTGYTTEWRNNIQSDITLRHDLSRIIKGLKVQGKFAFDAYNYHTVSRTRGYTDRYIALGRDAEGDLQLHRWYDGPEDLGYSKGAGGNRRVYTQANINYDRKFADHTISGLVLYNQEDYQTADATDAISGLPYRYLGLVGRVTYNFKDKYFAEFNAGYNGSENFEKGNRFGFFPSYAAGWIVSEESFFKDNINAVEFLKLRGSYGFKGNDEIGGRRFAYLTTVGGGRGGYTYGVTANNYYSGRGEDEWGVSLTWEKEEEINVGVETRFLKGFYIQADIFRRHRSGIFLPRQSLPLIMGLQKVPWGNIGEFENKGIDASLEYRTTIGVLDITLRGNYTFARNNVFENDQPDWKYTYQNRKGLRLNQPFGLIAEGLFRDQEEINNSPAHTFAPVRPGDIKYKDINGDGVIDSYDEVPIGDPSIPEVVYGFGTTVSYKGFDVSLFFQGTGNMDFMLGGGGWWPYGEGGLNGNVSAHTLSRWTPENPSQDVLFPRLSFGINQNNIRSSTWWQRDASYLRLKTAELGYTVPKQLIQKFKINSVRFYVSGFNVITWSKFDFWDPELGSGSGAAYPLMRTFNVGLNANF